MVTICYSATKALLCEDWPHRLSGKHACSNLSTSGGLETFRVVRVMNDDTRWSPLLSSASLRWYLIFKINSYDSFYGRATEARSGVETFGR